MDTEEQWDPYFLDIGAPIQGCGSLNTALKLLVYKDDTVHWELRRIVLAIYNMKTVPLKLSKFVRKHSSFHGKEFKKYDCDSCIIPSLLQTLSPKCGEVTDNEKGPKGNDDHNNRNACARVGRIRKTRRKGDKQTDVGSSLSRLACVDWHCQGNLPP